MDTQEEITRTIVECNKECVLSLNENQKSLHDDVGLYFKEERLTKFKEDLKKDKYHVTYDKSHDRIEKDIEWLS